MFLFSHNGDDPLKTLNRIADHFDTAQKELESELGVSICIPDCGKCCKSNCITTKPIEAAWVADWVRKQKPAVRDKVVKACENWLLDTKGFQVFKGMNGKFLSEETDQIQGEMSWLVYRGICPLLDEDNSCMIHPVRPIVCRAWGVTRNVPSWCPRPLGKYEEGDYRAYLNNTTTDKAKEAIEDLKGQLDPIFGDNHTFLATALYAELEPHRFLHYAYHNFIPTVKMARMSGGSLLWQEQVNEETERAAEIGTLCVSR